MVGAALAFIYFIVALGAPLAYIFKEAFVVSGSLSLGNFSALFADEFLVKAILNSLEIASTATILSFLVSFPLSVLFTTYNFRLKKMWEFLLLFPLFLPPFVGALGIQAFLGRSGIINETLIGVGLGNLTVDFFASNREFGIALVQALHLFPLLFLGLKSSMSRLNADFEDAARLSGASNVRVLFKIILPLLTPAMVTGCVLVFVGSFTDIGTPLLFEFRSNVAVIIFNMVTDVGGGGAGFALISIVALVGVLMYGIVWLVESLVPVQMYDKGFRPRTPKRESSVRFYLLWVVLISVVVLSSLGHIGVVINALSDYWFMTPLPTGWTAKHLQEVFLLPLSYTALINSIWLSLVATCVSIFIGTYIAWRSVRKPSRVTVGLNFLGMVPLFIPGVVCAYGYTVAFSGTFVDNRTNPFPLLILAYSLRKLPFVIRLLVAGISQVSPALEEAGRIQGASSSRVFKMITLPLIYPHIIAASILCYLGSLLEVSDSLLLPLEEKFYPITKAMFSIQARPDGTPVASALGLVVMSVVLGGAAIASRYYSAGKGASQGS